MKKIGITGGIGSGKTTICKELEKLGYKVYYSDDVAIDLANNNQQLKNEIISNFGEKAYIDGVYNRKYISLLVFNDDDRLYTLNSLFKRYMNEDFTNYCQANKDCDYIFYESALIFEQTKQFQFDTIIVVYCEDEIVIDRVIKRNNLSREEVLKRINSQMSPKAKCEYADLVIDTTNSDYDVNKIIKFIKHEY